MAAIRTLYELFGVDLRATTEQIRAAYLALLKQHHPDLPDNPSSTFGRAQFVADLNVAFETLRDPQKRADYDRQLPASSIPGPLARKSKPRPVSVRHVPRPTALRAFIVAIAFVLATGVIAFQSVDSTVANRLLAWPADNWGMADAPDRRRASPIALDARDVHLRVKAALSLSIDQAIDVSGNCFRDAADNDKPQATSLCIIFDNAVQIWAFRTDYDESIPSYFQLRWTHTRHLDALSKWGADNELVLEQLRALLLREILAQIHATHAIVPLAELVPQAQAGVPGIALSEVEDPVDGKSRSGTASIQLFPFDKE